MTKVEFLNLAGQDFDEWSQSQNGQTDPYEYERSFDELMQLLSRRLFQLSLGKTPSDHRKKNDSHPVWPH